MTIWSHEQREVTWPTWVHVTFWEIHISTFTTLNLAGRRLRRGSLARKRLSHHRFFVVFFSLSFFSLPRFWTDWQTFFACVQPAVSGNICYQNRMYVVVTLTNSYVYDRKFCVWKHGMLCALKINSNDRFKRACGILLFNDYISSNSIAVYIH